MCGIYSGMECLSKKLSREMRSKYARVVVELRIYRIYKKKKKLENQSGNTRRSLATAVDRFCLDEQNHTHTAQATYTIYKSPLMSFMEYILYIR